jgi:hypothetical protein
VIKTVLADKTSIESGQKYEVLTSRGINLLMFGHRDNGTPNRYGRHKSRFALIDWRVDINYLSIIENDIARSSTEATGAVDRNRL